MSTCLALHCEKWTSGDYVCFIIWSEKLLQSRTGMAFFCELEGESFPHLRHAAGFSTNSLFSIKKLPESYDLGSFLLTISRYLVRMLWEHGVDTSSKIDKRCIQYRNDSFKYYCGDENFHENCCRKYTVEGDKTEDSGVDKLRNKC